MATVKTPIYDDEEWRNPNVVKVVTDRSDYALYFSRSPIPCSRDSVPASESQGEVLAYRHIGLYVYRKDFLLTFTGLTTDSAGRDRKT